MICVGGAGTERAGSGTVAWIDSNQFGVYYKSNQSKWINNSLVTSSDTTCSGDSGGYNGRIVNGRSIQMGINSWVNFIEDDNGNSIERFNSIALSIYSNETAAGSFVRQLLSDQYSSEIVSFSITTSSSDFLSDLFESYSTLIIIGISIVSCLCSLCCSLVATCVVILKKNRTQSSNDISATKDETKAIKATKQSSIEMEKTASKNDVLAPNSETKKLMGNIKNQSHVVTVEDLMAE